MLHVNVYIPFWWSAKLGKIFWRKWCLQLPLSPIPKNMTLIRSLRTQRPSTYPQSDATPCSPSRWCTVLCRAEVHVVASPLHRAAGSGVRAHTCWCRHRTADSRRARRWSSSHSRAPSPADSLWAQEGTWTAPSGRTARTAHMSPSIGAQPTETAPSQIRSWGAFCKGLFILILPNMIKTSEQFVITLSDAPFLQEKSSDFRIKWDSERKQSASKVTKKDQ